MAALFAAEIKIAPENGLFPLAVHGVNVGPVLVTSLFASIVSASLSYWMFGRHLDTYASASSEVQPTDQIGILRPINESGAGTLKIVAGILPMLILSLTFVLGLERSGAVNAFSLEIQPTPTFLSVDPSLIAPLVTKVLAGGTALVGVVNEMVRNDTLSHAALKGQFLFWCSHSICQDWQYTPRPFPRSAR